MNTYDVKTKFEKRFYSKPELNTIKIDNQISMVMMSDSNPEGDPEKAMNLQHPNTDNPYKILRG